MLLHIPYSIVVTTPDARCRTRMRRGPVLGDGKKKKKKETSDQDLHKPVAFKTAGICELDWIQTQTEGGGGI